MSKYIKKPKEGMFRQKVCSGVGRQQGSGTLTEALRRRLAVRACPLRKMRELALGVIEFNY